MCIYADGGTMIWCFSCYLENSNINEYFFSCKTNVQENNSLSKLLLNHSNFKKGKKTPLFSLYLEDAWIF